MQRPWAALWILALLSVGCGSSDKPKDSRREASPPPTGADTYPIKTFDVDPAMLGFTYEDSTLALRFAPPRGWPPIETALMEDTKAALEKLAVTEHRLSSRPVRIFVDHDRRLYMILSEFPSWPAPLDPIPAMAEYRQRLAASDPDITIQDAFYRHGKFTVYQLVLINPLMVDTRVILMRGGKAPVQIDYLSPRALFPDLAAAIEASIGSMQSY